MKLSKIAGVIEMQLALKFGDKIEEIKSWGIPAYVLIHRIKGRPIFYCSFRCEDELVLDEYLGKLLSLLKSLPEEYWYLYQLQSDGAVEVSGKMELPDNFGQRILNLE